MGLIYTEGWNSTSLRSVRHFVFFATEHFAMLSFFTVKSSSLSQALLVRSIFVALP